MALDRAGAGRQLAYLGLSGSNRNGKVREHGDRGSYGGERAGC